MAIATPLHRPSPPSAPPAWSRIPLQPRARGTLSDVLIGTLTTPRRSLDGVPPAAGASDDDLHLALYLSYEHHYGGFPQSDPAWEWEPSLIALREDLEEVFLDRLRAAVGTVGSVPPGDVVSRLWEMARSTGGVSLSAWVLAHARLEHVQEMAVHRSAYQLKEADPHTWAIPRLGGRAKAAMVAIQADEYGAGEEQGMHCRLFAETMGALGLDPTPNRYLDAVPGATLATTNLISLFGLHRRWRGALVGHLALFEMTSTGPMARYAAALRRLGVDERACRFYDVHVEADEVHQFLAADEMVAGLIEAEPDLAGDVVFGASALQSVEAALSGSLLSCWAGGRSSLRRPPG